MKLQLESKQALIDNCNSELYALIGTNEAGVSDFRIKFSEMEKKFRSSDFTPDGMKSEFYSEIVSSKIRCLPEFSDRFVSMMKKLEIPVQIKTPEGIYLVAKGDCLWNISKEKLGNPALWPAIWNVNKDGVYNKNIMPYYSQKITNPDLIYPGQEIRIPAVSDTEKLMKESLKSLRKRRKGL
jgi:LysM repeat protein